MVRVGQQIEDFEFEFYKNQNSKKVKFSGGWGLSTNGSAG